MTTQAEDFIQHYGVRGMKWGIRKRSGGSSGGRSKAELTPRVNMTSADAIAFREIKDKARRYGTSSLSNEEIRLVTTRLELEKKYTTAFPKKQNPVVKFFVDDLLVKTGKSLASEVVKSQGQRYLIDKNIIAKGKNKDDDK